MSTTRLWGAAAAFVSASLLFSIVYLSLGPDSLVIPTVKYGPAAGVTDQVGEPDLAVGRTMTQRAELFSERAVGDGKLSLDLSKTTTRLAPVQRNTGDAELVVDWLEQVPEIGNTKLLQEPDFREGTTSLPYREMGVLVQPDGRKFRRLHNNEVRYGGGVLIFGVFLALGLFLAGRGRIPLAEGESGRTIVRFSANERAAHWMTATAFILMALTGLVMLYGKPILLPWMGAAAFSTLAGWSAWVHMSAALPFVLGILLMVVMWIGGNIPNRLDWIWIKSGGGFVGARDSNPPAARFNAGQKVVFWGVVLGGIAMLLTGLGLMFPFYWTGYTGMQSALLLHASIALLMVALIIGHIYIGTIGMVGAFQAMWSGRVDRNWAKEHHSIWFQEQAGAAAQQPPRVAAREDGDGGL